MMPNLVFINNSRPMTDSLTIAETFGKNHKDVLRDIRNLECSDEFNQRNFAPIDYQDSMNRTYQKFLITQDGFSFLVMGYTGKEAARFKEMYINEFNRMKNQISQPFQLPQNYKEALVALVEQVEENEKIQSEKLQLQERIEADRPLVLFAESLQVSKETILVADLAKLLKQNGIDIGEQRLFRWLRENGYLIKSGTEYNMPTQRSMELMLFEIKTGTRNGSDGTVRITRTPKITGKGQVYFLNKFKQKGATA